MTSATSGSGSVNQVMEVTVTFYQKDPLISVASVLATSSNKEILIGATSSEISYHLRNIYSIYMCCWNGATYKLKVHMVDRYGISVSE
jgi:hypothetical protein